MTRTTIDELKTVVHLLNQNAGVAENQPGSYILAKAYYGGWELQQIVGSGPSQKIVVILTGYNTGYLSKRELLGLICAYRAGFCAGNVSRPQPPT